MSTVSQLSLFALMLLVFPVSSLASNKTTAGEKCTLVKNCEEKAQNASRSCYDFMDLLDEKCGRHSDYCDKYKLDLIKACTIGFCNECYRKAQTAYQDCVKFYRTTLPSAKNAETVCNKTKGELHQKCPGICKGFIGSKGTTKGNPGKSCKDILETNRVPSGVYWIKPDGDKSPVQAYCDMSFQGGGWTLASYGYVATTAYGVQDKRNKNIPNMNHPNGYNWHPTNRASSNGLISLEHGAVNLARGARSMIMAAGNNPTNGGIDGYSHVYFIDISQNPRKITFANHNRFHGAVGTSTIPKMHVVEFTVKALKGESGSAKRYALGEALGVTWSDSYPTGYGFSPVNGQYGTWNKGPFFPSVQTGDGNTGGNCKSAQSFPPDVKKGCPSYVHYGWHSLHAIKKTGQTSVWFK